jgi:hypothetical protein
MLLLFCILINIISFTGPLKIKIFSAMYTSVLLSFLIMQILVEWNNYQIKKNSQISILNYIMIKTGIVTLFVVIITSLNVLVDSYYPVNNRNENFYLYKDFISCMCAFVITPSAFILRNQTTIIQHFKKWISSTQMLTSCKGIINGIIRFFYSITQYFKRNTIHPIL